MISPMSSSAWSVSSCSATTAMSGQCSTVARPTFVISTSCAITSCPSSSTASPIGSR